MTANEHVREQRVADHDQAPQCADFEPDTSRRPTPSGRSSARQLCQPSTAWDPLAYLVVGLIQFARALTLPAYAVAFTASG